MTNQSTASEHAEQRGLDEVVLRVRGMHCASCVGRVEKMLSRVPGVQTVTVSLPAERAMIRGTALEAQQLADIVDTLGFEAAILNPHAHTPQSQPRHDHPERKEQGGEHADTHPNTHPDTHDHADHADHAEARPDIWRWRVILGFALVIPLKALHWFHEPLGVPMAASMWISAALGTIGAIIIGWPFFVGAIKSLRTRSATMDTLVALGASAAIIVSWAGMIQWLATNEHAPMYFAEAAALLTLIGLGRLFESRLASITTTDTKALLQAQPGEAVIVSEPDANDGERIPTTRVRPGDLVLIPAGERVPVDGEIVRGSASFDEAVITGESIPVERGVGETVVAGAVNAGAAVVVRASVDGSSTTIARIADMIEHARASKVPMQAIADRITAVFVPIVLSIAAAAFLGWWLIGGASLAEAGIIAATVLVIACPCALGLATPLAVMAGVGGAARLGIFLRDAAALQRAARVQTVVFDKTGTLTHGTPRVLDADDESLRLAAAVCVESSHPIARAIVSEARHRGLDIPRAQHTAERAGAGMTGRVNEQEISVLSIKAAQADGIDLEAIMPNHADADANANTDANTGANTDAPEPEHIRGASRSVVLRDREPIATIALRDEPRDDAAPAIRALRQAGLAAHMLSGDRASAARATARAVGIDPEDVHAELSPEDKLSAIRALAEDHRRSPVAMVGDGINDAPALAEASARGGIAIAIGSGTAAAIESADAIAPGDRLQSVPELFAVARKTMGAIKVNLTLAFVYNSAAVPIAALGLLGTQGPLVAAIAMGISNACVVGNSAWLAVRLRRLG